MANASNATLSSAPIHAIFGAAAYIVISPPTAVCNLLIAASIFKYRALRDRKEMILLMALATADALNLCSFASAGIYRLRVLLSGLHETPVTTMDCLKHPHMWLWSFSFPLSSLMLVAVSSDRLALVALRATYMFGFTGFHAWIAVSICFGFCMGFGLLAGILSVIYGDPHAVLNPMCYTPFAFASPLSVSKVFEQWYSYSISIFPLLSVIIFALVPVFYKWHKAKVSPSTTSNVSQHLKRQQKLTKSIALSCTCTLFLACLPGRLGYVLYDMEYYFAARSCFVLLLFNPLANILIYHFVNRDLRTALRGLIWCKMLPDNIDLWPGNYKPRVQKNEERDTEV